MSSQGGSDRPWTHTAGLATAALLSVVVAGCGGGAPAVGTTSTGGGGHAPNPPVTAGAPPRCVSSDMAARLVGTASSRDQYKLVLELTNHDSKACTLTGFPGFELVGPMSDGSTTYDPVRQQVSYQAVTVPGGGTAHADFFALPGPDSCDAGQAWVPTSVSVTLPDTTTSFSVAWPGGSVDNCQGGATHPGTYVGPVEAGP